MKKSARSRTPTPPGAGCPRSSRSKGGPYHIITTFKVGGEGGWDCLVVDPESERMFVPRGTRVMVLKTDDGAQVGEIADTAGVHAVALAPALNKGFTSNGRANTVT